MLMIRVCNWMQVGSLLGLRLRGVDKERELCFSVVSGTDLEYCERGWARRGDRRTEHRGLKR